MKTQRHLHLVGATGTIRTAVLNDREHLVVPVVAMVEGVVWASNSEFPEFVPAEELALTPEQWNGRPFFAGHPKNGSTPVSANTPSTYEQSFGLIFDTASAEQILRTRRLEFNVWIDPEKAKKVGPDAVEIVERLQADEMIEVSVGALVEIERRHSSWNKQEYRGIWRSIVSDHVAGLSRKETGACSIDAGCGAPRYAVRHLVTADGLRREGKMAEPIEDAETVVEKPPQKHAACGCKTTPCRCTHSKGDRTMADKMTRAESIAALVTDKFSGFHDGDEAFLETLGDSRLEEHGVRAAEYKSTVGQIARLETDNRNLSARLKVAEDRLRIAEAPLSEDEFEQRAPERFKLILNERRASEDATKAAFISQLKDLGANTEDELKKMSIPQLQTLAAYARIEVPDFSGRSMPRLNARQETNDDFVPPNPYAEGLKALQATYK